MESKKSLWLFVGLVVALAVMCCCALAVAAVAGAPWWIGHSSSESEGLRLPSWRLDVPFTATERVERTLEVSGAPRLTIRNFAGSVTVRPGEAGTVHMVATKRVRGAADSDQIEVEMSQQACCVEITTHKASDLDDASVSLEITVPAGTVLDITTGAGTVDVQDVQGALRVEAGAGTVEIRGAAGPVSLRTGAGTIDYEGSPDGTCSFDTGAGTITLRVPADTDASVELGAGMGGVHTTFDVNGVVSRRLVRGTIGSGDGATITANTGVGSVELLRQ
jgi:hypothetical protein